MSSADDIHVYPLNDLREHVTDGPGCSCNPKVELVGAHLLYVHNSFDFREVFEELDTLVDECVSECRQ